MFTAVNVSRHKRRFPKRVYQPGGNSYMTSSFRSYESKTRIYVWEVGESILDNLQNRRSRPRTEYKREILRLFPELAGKLRWSQYAGCSCPCSPGFIVDDYLRDGGTPIDIYISVGHTAYVRKVAEAITNFARGIGAPHVDDRWLALVGETLAEQPAQPSATDIALKRAGYVGTELLSAA